MGTSADAYAVLQQLQRAALDTETESEARFVIVNETHALIPYEQAAVWNVRRRKVTAMSNVVSINSNSPFLSWLAEIIEHYHDPKEIRRLTPSDTDDATAARWGESLPTHAVIVPFLSRGRAAEDFLLLARGEPFADYEVTLLSELALYFGQALRLHRRSVPKWTGLIAWRGPTRIALVLLTLAFLLFPVRLSVLAGAEVVPNAPFHVRAPFDGVIEEIHVEPYQAVSSGDLLLSLDATEISNQKTVAQRAVELAEAEYRQAAQAAVFDADSKLAVAIFQGRLEQRRAELQYYTDLTERLEVRAPQRGIVVFNDASTLIGRPVNTGEAIFVVAQPNDVKLRFQLPVEDAIELEEGANVRLFLSISPNDPVEAQVTFVGFTATPNESGTLVYPGEAVFTATGNVPRVGLRGTAKLYGSRYPMVYWLLRKPLAFFRQFFGW